MNKFLVVLVFAFSLSSSARGQELFLDSLCSNPLNPDAFDSKTWYWMKVTPKPSSTLVELTKWGEIIDIKSKARTGLNLKASEKSYYSYRNLLPINSNEELVLKVKGNHPLFKLEDVSTTFFSDRSWRRDERQRFITHGIFYGILLGLALYNLMIYFSVNDQSYLWYVLGIIGFGLYMAFYYGFSFELFWPESPYWNAYFFALIIPLTNVSRALFTKTYLHTKEYVPGWNKFFNFLLILYLLPITMWFCSWYLGFNLLVETNYVIGFLGSVIMIAITFVSFIVYRRGYQPALWFLTAFLLFNIGGILFIFRELGYLPDNFFTRYVVQIGAIAQVIIFSLGLSSRLNRTNKMLAMRTLEKERLAREQEIEKKALVERQRNELETKVKERTQELELILGQLQISEAELRELNQLKSRLFAIISHDLKSPLATVDSFLNLLINHYNKLSPDELSDLSSKTQFALQNLTLLLDNLLLWSRFQQDSLSFNPKDIELYRVVDKSLKLFVLLIEQKKLTIEVGPEVDDALIYGDKDMIEFIVRNLIHNAIKFTPKGGEIMINCSFGKESIKISFKDSGTSLTESMIKQIMHTTEGFTNEGTEQEKGSGIGLIMCKDFIERNSGTFEIDITEGTVITIQLSGYRLH